MYPQNTYVRALEKDVRKQVVSVPCIKAKK